MYWYVLAQEEKPEYKVDYVQEVKLINIFVSVTDGQNNFVNNLKKEDFTVKEDGKPQKITHFSLEVPPLVVLLLLDASASMLEELTRDMRKADIAKNAALEFIDRIRKEDKCGIITIEDYAYQSSAFPADIFAIKKELLFFEPQQKNTALYDAIYLAAETLKSYKTERKVIVIFSDGLDSASRVKYEEAMNAVIARDISIYGYVTAKLSDSTALRGYATLEILSKESGGKIIAPSTIGETAKKAKELENELFNVYSIAYEPPKLQKRGKYHKIEVALKTKGATLRYKRAYIE